MLLGVLLVVVFSRSRKLPPAAGAASGAHTSSDSAADDAADYYDDVEFAAVGAAAVAAASNHATKSRGHGQPHPRARASTDARFGPPPPLETDMADFNDIDFDELDFNLFRAGAAAERARALAARQPRPAAAARSAKNTSAMVAAGVVADAHIGGAGGMSEYESIMAALALVKEARRAKESGAPATRRNRDLKSKIVAVRNTIMSADWGLDDDDDDDDDDAEPGNDEDSYKVVQAAAAPAQTDATQTHKASFNVLDERANRISQYSVASHASSAMTDGEDWEC